VFYSGLECFTNVDNSSFFNHYSKYGNTKRLAELIIKGIKQTRSVECTLKSIGEIHTTDLCDYDVILFGCPNHNQAPSRGITTFIERAGIVGLPLILIRVETRALLSNSLKRKYEMHYLECN
jgi:multimeric flavodoxin WrbA